MEQSERIERIILGITGSSWSPQAIQELREQMTWDATHPRSPEEMQRGLEEVWAMIGEEARHDTRTMDELLGYDEIGLPT